MLYVQLCGADLGDELIFKVFISCRKNIALFANTNVTHIDQEEISLLP